MDSTRAERIGTRTAEQAVTAVGEQLEATAEVVRERLPEEGRAGRVSGAISDAISHAGRYLQRQGFHGAIADVEESIRRYPAQSLLAGAVAGFLLSRLHRP